MVDEDKEFERRRRNKINEIKDHTKEARNQRALLCYKYDTLKFRMNVLQVLIIIISTMITFLEAIKTHYQFDETAFNVTTISMSTIIAFTMAIYRFFRIEENKENIKQSLESHVFIINKLFKMIHSMENFSLTDNNIKDWEQLELNYNGEIYDNYIAIKEKFDAIFSFQDSIYYKRKYKRDFLELEFTNKEIQLVDQYKGAKHSEFVLRLKGWIYYIMCCDKRERVDYTIFMNKAEEGKLRMIKHSAGTQTENQNEQTQYPSPFITITPTSTTVNSSSNLAPPPKKDGIKNRKTSTSTSTTSGVTLEINESVSL